MESYRPNWLVEFVNGLRRGKDPASLLAGASYQEIEFMHRDWRAYARPDQWQPPGDWLVWLLLGGRGAGKTRAGAEWVRGDGARRSAPPASGPIALVGETFADVREVMIEGVSGLLAHP